MASRVDRRDSRAEILVGSPGDGLESTPVGAGVTELGPPDRSDDEAGDGIEREAEEAFPMSGMGVWTPLGCGATR